MKCAQGGRGAGHKGMSLKRWQNRKAGEGPLRALCAVIEFRGIVPRAVERLMSKDAKQSRWCD